VTNIKASIDHIEFDDGTIIGPDSGGSRVVKSQREGARKYKEWLVAQYNQTHSISGIVSLLGQGEDLPQNVGLRDSNEENGARIFREQERQVYERKGATTIQKHLEAGKKPL
jgi:hypothetical protein